MLLSFYAFSNSPTNALWLTFVRKYEMLLLEPGKYHTHKTEDKKAGYLYLGCNQEPFPSGSHCRHQVHKIYDAVLGGPGKKQQLIVWHVIRHSKTNEIQAVWLDTMKEETDEQWDSRCNKWLQAVGN